jgi:hypothetical protein
MKQTSLSAARGQMEAPLRAPHGQVEGRTGSQLIRGVRRTPGERGVGRGRQRVDAVQAATHRGVRFHSLRRQKEMGAQE